MSSADWLRIQGKLLATARMEEEWYEDVSDVESVIGEIRRAGRKVDIFVFWERFPNTDREYVYHMEHEAIAVLPVTTFDHWWKAQINSKTRSAVRKAQKSGVSVERTSFTDDFVAGMVEVFNETRTRQGRPFLHYGKDFDRVKMEFARNLHREEIYGAYFEGRLIGFLFLAYADRYAMLTQIISKLEHRDRSPNNALIAKAVEACAEKKVPHLIYARWPDGPLADFKRHNGFERVQVPVYYVPLTLRGRIALRLNLHHGIAAVAPGSIRRIAAQVRKRWYASVT